MKEQIGFQRLCEIIQFLKIKMESWSYVSGGGKGFVSEESVSAGQPGALSFRDLEKDQTTRNLFL